MALSPTRTVAFGPYVITAELHMLDMPPNVQARCDHIFATLIAKIDQDFRQKRSLRRWAAISYRPENDHSSQIIRCVFERLTPTRRTDNVVASWPLLFRITDATVPGGTLVLRRGQWSISPQFGKVLADCKPSSQSYTAELNLMSDECTKISKAAPLLRISHSLPPLPPYVSQLPSSAALAGTPRIGIQTPDHPNKIPNGEPSHPNGKPSGSAALALRNHMAAACPSLHLRSDQLQSSYSVGPLIKNCAPSY